MRKAVRWSATLALVVLLLLAGSIASAQESEEPAEPNTLGTEVYTAVCAACHQTDGRGLAGAFPPLVDNPNVADADYVTEVILNGREGEITVAGETYNGVMPAFSTLTGEEVAAVVAYVQNDLGRPAAGETPAVAAGPVAGTELPTAAATVWRIGIWLAVLASLVVAVPTVLARSDGAAISWSSAWLKAALIVVFFAVATVWLPSAILEIGAVATAPRVVQDLIGSGVWMIALVAGLFGLRWAQKDRRI